MFCALITRDIGGIIIDVVVSESVTEGMEVPEHPVENGVKISDHAYRKPTTLKMSCASGDREATFQSLKDLMKEAEPFDIITGFGLFESFIIDGLEATRDADTGHILQIDVSLKEIVIVSTSTSGQGDERGDEETNRGQVQAKKVAPAAAKKESGPSSEDLLYQLDAV